MNDLVIIGGGPAGLTAGLYAARAGIETLLLEKTVPGGQALLTEWIENYPGFPEGIRGSELSEKMEEQARKFGLKTALEEVVSITPRPSPILVKTPNKEYETLALIVATGVVPAKLKVPGEEELTGRGVSYCATCDGPLFKDKKVVAIGGGDTAVEETIFLSKFAKGVTLIHRRDRLRATKIIQERALANPKIDFLWNSVVTEIGGKERVEGIRVKNLKTEKVSELACEGVFIFVGSRPNTAFLKGTVEMNEKGYIITDEEMKTSARGIYASGDVRQKSLRQVITACGEGAIAAFSAQHYVEKLKGIEYK